MLPNKTTNPSRRCLNNSSHSHGWHHFTFVFPTTNFPCVVGFIIILVRYKETSFDFLGHSLTLFHFRSPFSLILTLPLPFTTHLLSFLYIDSILSEFILDTTFINLLSQCRYTSTCICLICAIFLIITLLFMYFTIESAAEIKIHPVINRVG